MNAASNRLRRTHPTTLYWRSMRRVERRAARFVQTRDTHPVCGDCQREDLALLFEATRPSAVPPIWMKHRCWCPRRLAPNAPCCCEVIHV